MNDEHFPLRDQLAITEAISHWFAFFEGETVPTHSQLALFTDDIQLIHAGQHLLAAGKEQMEQWLNSVPPETCSHFVQEVQAQRIQPGIYAVLWQTPYQAVRENGAIGGAIIQYRAQVQVSADGTAQFMALQKTPLAANPETTFRPSFDEHRATALCCCLQRWLDSDDAALPAAIHASEQVVELLLKLNQSNGERHLSLKSEGEGKLPSLVIATHNGNFELKLQQQTGWYPAIIHSLAI